MKRYYEAMFTDEGEELHTWPIEAVNQGEAQMLAETYAVEEEDRTGQHLLLIQVHESFRWVNAYSVERCYGGPEEGGWWYDFYTCLASFPAMSPEAAESAKKAMEETIGWENERTRYSVIGGADFETRIECERARSESHERPHYE